MAITFSIFSLSELFFASSGSFLFVLAAVFCCFGWGTIAAGIEGGGENETDSSDFGEATSSVLKSIAAAREVLTGGATDAEDLEDFDKLMSDAISCDAIEGPLFDDITEVRADVALLGAETCGKLLTESLMMVLLLELAVSGF